MCLPSQGGRAILDRDEESVPHLLLPNLNPQLTFQQFMRTQHDNVTPKDARAHYLRFVVFLLFPHLQ